MIPLYKVWMSQSIAVPLLTTLHSGFIGEGDKVKEFEKAFADWLGTDDDVLATNSCTSALHLAMHLAKNGNSGGEVLTSPLTCFAGIAAIIANGLRVRWVDVNFGDGNMNLDDLKRKLSPSTVAIMATHFAGYPNRLDALYDIAYHHNHAWVIEDCAHCLGSEYEGVKIGSRKPLSSSNSIRCFSFQAVKPLTTVDGGAIIVPRHLYHRAKNLRWYGINRDDRSTPIFESGYKFHMNDVAATIGLCNLKDLDGLLKVQEAHRKLLIEKLSAKVRFMHLDWHEICEYNPSCVSRCGVMPIVVDHKDKFETAMRARGVQVEPPHTMCHKHPCVKQFYEDLPNADGLEREMTAIPAGWWLSEVDLDRIVEAVKAGR